LTSGRLQQLQQRHQLLAAHDKVKPIQKECCKESSWRKKVGTVNVADGVTRVQLALMSCIGWLVKTEHLPKRSKWKQIYFNIAIQNSMVILGMIQQT
jgi:hypothetical protein